MYNSIILAKIALKLFLQSLPFGCKFNIVSYGSNHEFMFKQSAAYSDKTLKEALEKVEKFSANFGLTEIYKPLDDVFTEIKGRKEKRDYTS